MSRVLVTLVPPLSLGKLKNISEREVEAGKVDLQVQGQPGLQNEFPRQTETQRNPTSKKKKSEIVSGYQFCCW